MMRRLLLLPALVFPLTAWAAQTPAAPPLPAPKQVFDLQKDTTLDGKKIAHAPGDVFAIKAGKAQTLRIINFTGASGKPVVFVNLGGIVDVANTDRGYAIVVQGCTHVRLTGSGPLAPGQATADPYAAACGIRCSTEKKGMMTVHVNGKSSDIEVDHLEVYGAGFAGFNVKDEPKEDGSTNRDAFVMYNILLHDNYVHDTEGEGFYIGHTFYGGYKDPKSGKTLMPHVIKGLRVYNNRTYNTACEGIQCGSTVEDCEIYNNSIIKFGQRPFADWQNNGMQVGSGTQARVYNNWLQDGPGCGFTIFGEGDLYFYNNVVIRAGSGGTYVNTKEGKSYTFANNTYINNGGDAMRFGNFGATPAKVTVVNNLLVNEKLEKNKFINPMGSKSVEEKNNLTLEKLTDAKFVAPDKDDYRLRPDSPARGKGLDLRALGVTFDLFARERPAGPTDAGACQAETADPAKGPAFKPEAPATKQPPKAFTNKR
ncbi:MAG: right-handed parallel beta-helix repeat-containing protein [Planctomycetota bacterium]|nr:right-handed parallel beta-helix repeat-containing protein [Planctomycetota bacterium]